MLVITPIKTILNFLIMCSSPFFINMFPWRLLESRGRHLTMSLLELFCDVDDFMLSFEPHWKASRLRADKQRARTGQLCPSEVMTILIHFHQSHYRPFILTNTLCWLFDQPRLNRTHVD